MKKIFKLKFPLLIVLVILALGLVLSACDSINNEGKTPEQLIQDAYGNKEFKISFSTGNLDAPIKDMTYTANSIPQLPTPKKIGYIFEGWYLDPKFVTPYTDGALYLLMQDITLYPKWTKEKFINNGTYDVEFESKIVEDSLHKGSSTDEFGGYRDLSNQILYNECYIEKNDEELVFKLKYDGVVTTPFQSKGEVFTISINDSMGTGIYINKKIDSQADPVKTLFIKIDKWDLTKPLYLDVQWTNYEHKDLTEANRYQTTTTYTVGIQLKNIIGFSQAFVDTNVPLEKGYYLAKSYLRQENNTESMAKTYNPVYSYIYSDGHENYKLIKQNSPYVGLVADKHPLYDPLINNYYDSMMAFVAMTTCYDMESRGFEGEVKSDYYPETYNAGYYRKTVTEFHADSGKFYNIIDLDKDLSKEYLALTAVSGFMERADGMGYIRQILSVDYKNLIKLAEVDYQPLEGECYEYETQTNFYPGNVDDLDKNNLTYDAVLKHGVSIEMPNFFYSAPSQYASLNDRTIHSSRVEVTPTKQTSGINISKSRNIIAEFNINTKVYGYDVKDNNLYLDRMNPQAFAGLGYNNQLRDVTQVKTGKNCKINDVIKVDELFNEKVNPTFDFSNVTYKAYEMQNGNINYNKTVPIINREIKFSKDVAIEYKFNDGKDDIKTIVELRNLGDPKITIQSDINWKFNKESGHYETSSIYKVGDIITFPDIKYTWGEVTNNFVQNYYESMGGNSINPSQVIMFANRKDYKKTYLVYSHADQIELPEMNVSLMYELNNVYGESYFVYFDYFSDARRSYIIKDNNGKTLAENDIKFDEEGNRKSVYNSYTYDPIYRPFKVSDIRSFKHIENGFTNDYRVSYFDIYCGMDGNLLNQTYIDKEGTIDIINNFIKDKGYACITFRYTHDYDVLDVNYLYNITFNGEDKYETLNYGAYFSNTPYVFGMTKLVGSNMQPLADVRVDIKKYVDGRPSNNIFDQTSCKIDYQGRQVTILFYVPGTYKLNLNYSVDTNLLGRPTDSRKQISFSQMLTVDSNVGDIQITYVTDERHPFKDGTQSKTVTHNLGEGITLLGQDNTVFDINKFQEGRKYDALFAWSNTKGMYGEQYNPKGYIKGEDFIEEYNSKHITLYAIWEIKLSIECNCNGKIINLVANLDKQSNTYVVKFPNKKYIPTGMVFAGWQGGFISGITKDSSYRIPYRDDYYDTEKYKDYLKCEAVYKKEYTVVFNIDTNIARPKSSEVVLDGDTLENPNEKMNLVMKDTSKKFVGYKVQGEGETIVDLYTYKITKNTVFIAVFE